MRRALIWAAGILGALVLLPLLAVMLAVIAANTDPGRRLIERQAASLTGGMVALSGLSGSFPAAPRIGHLELRDADGVWLTIDGLVLDWSPWRLLSGVAEIDRLAAARIGVARLPVPSGKPSPSSGGSQSALPVRVVLKQLNVAQADVAAPVAGVAASLGITGSADVTSLEDGSVTLDAKRIDSPGAYHADGALTPANVEAHVVADEPARGLIATVAGVPDIGPLHADATAGGPMDATAIRLALTGGPLRANAEGTVNVTGSAADLRVTASAPEMHPAPGISWRAVALDAHVSGPFTKPDAAGTLRIEQAEAAGASLSLLSANLAGNAGQAHLDGRIEGLRVPGPQPGILASAPLNFAADARLDAPDKPVIFRLSHPLIAVEGDARTTGDIAARAHLTLPDLAPLASAGGADVRGSADLTLTAAMQGGATALAASGKVGITGGTAPVPGLIGGDGRIDAAATLRGNDVTIEHLKVDGRALSVAASGALTGGKADASFTVMLSDLAVLAPTLAGNAKLTGHADGPLDDFQAAVTMDGDIAARGLRRGPVHVALDARGLPGAPAGTLTATGELAEAPLAVNLDASRDRDGTLHATLARLEWKSLHGSGAATLPPGSQLPLGDLTVRMDRLDDLRPLIGQAIGGALTVSAKTDQKSATVRAQGTHVVLPGTGAVDRMMLEAAVADPLGHPNVTATFTADGAAASGAGGSVRMEARGPEDSLALHVAADLRNVGGAAARLDTRALLNMQASDTTISALQADWKGQTVRLLSPVRVSYKDGITLDRLRIGLGQAVLELAGRVSPTLDANFSARGITPALAAPFVPGLQADGALQAQGKLTGPPTQPSGTVQLTATGVHMRQGPGASLPPANLNARADLQGGSARVDARLTAGALAALTVTGRAPLDPSGPLDLRAGGTVDLRLLDPVLAANGRRARGVVTLDVTAAGSAAAPRLGGTVRLADGDVQDVAQGLHLTGITALLRGQGDTIRIEQFDARAGSGTIAIGGTVGAFAPGLPLDLTVTARGAQPLQSNLLTANLNADLTLRGQVQGQLTAAGTVHINRADINIPETLPPSVAVLNVRRPGTPQPTVPAAAGAAPPAPPTAVALALTVDAPRQIFVRGRGLDAEMGGTIRLGGTAAQPQPTGSFNLVRGQFSLAGQTLSFTKGVVGFDGGTITDPSIDFVASATNGSVTATLEVTGTASAPKIKLSSLPDLPQDEVLAHLLFGRSASQLSPFELAQIAAALAQLTGAGGGVDPLAAIRKGLGLDTLSVGGGGGTGTALQAGRYVAPGVYVGARQSVSGTGSQATVQVDLYKGLKLEGALGTSSGTSNGTQTTGTGADAGGSSLGLTYQFEY